MPGPLLRSESDGRRRKGRYDCTHKKAMDAIEFVSIFCGLVENLGSLRERSGDSNTVAMLAEAIRRLCDTFLSGAARFGKQERAFSAASEGIAEYGECVSTSVHGLAFVLAEEQLSRVALWLAPNERCNVLFGVDQWCKEVTQGRVNLTPQLTTAINETREAQLVTLGPEDATRLAARLRREFLRIGRRNHNRFSSGAEEATPRTNMERQSASTVGLPGDVLLASPTPQPAEMTPQGGAAPRGPHSRRPPDNAFRAWYIREHVRTSNQTEIANTMTQEGTPATQGQVSKWLKAVDEWHRAGGVIPDVQTLNAPAQAIYPAVIDMGARRDRLTSRQRLRRDPDADE